MGKLHRILSVVTLGAVLATQVATGVVFAAARGSSTTAPAVSVDTVLSSEYLLDNGMRIAVVAANSSTSTDVLGMVYYKGNILPYLDSAIKGKIIAGATAGTYDLSGALTDAYGASVGTLAMNFVVTTNSAGKYLVSCTGSMVKVTEDASTTTNFKCSESGRAKYAQNEAGEFASEVQAYLSGESTGPTVPSLNQILSSEFLTNGANCVGGTQVCRIVMMSIDPAQLAEYGITASYNTVGLVYTKGSIPTFDSVIFGNVGTPTTTSRAGSNGKNVNTTKVTFNGRWAYADKSSSDDMYINFIVKSKTDADGHGFYIVGGDGTWHAGSAEMFNIVESPRSKYAKSELKELQTKLDNYIAQNQANVDSEVNAETSSTEVATDSNTTETTSTTTTTSTTVEATADTTASVEAEEQATTDSDNQSSTYSDVSTTDSSSSWYASSIDSEWTGENCDANGENCKFNPSGNVNKLQAAKLMMSVINKRKVGQTANSEACIKGFTDLATGQWYGKVVCAAVELGLVTGADKTTFGTGPLNRAEAVTLLTRALGGTKFLSQLYKNQFGQACAMPAWTDASEVAGSWYADSARVAACMKLVSGIPNGDGTYRFGGAERLNRAQFAKMFHTARRYNTFAFYNGANPGTAGVNQYLIMTSFDGKKLDSCTPGPDLDAIEMTKADGTVSYVTSVVAWMLHNDLKCNKHKALQGLVGAPNAKASTSTGKVKANLSNLGKYTSIGNASYLVFDMGADVNTFSSLKVDMFGSDASLYNLYVSDRPASPDSWTTLKTGLTGTVTLSGADLKVASSSSTATNTVSGPDLAVTGIKKSSSNSIQFQVSNLGDKSIDQASLGGDGAGDTFIYVNGVLAYTTVLGMKAGDYDYNFLNVGGSTWFGSSTTLSSVSDVKVCIDSSKIISGDTNKSDDCFTQTL